MEHISNFFAILTNGCKHQWGWPRARHVRARKLPVSIQTCSLCGLTRAAKVQLPMPVTANNRRWSL